MPQTHENLENIVLAGVNFKNAYEKLRLRIRMLDATLTQSKDWLNTPSTIQMEWYALAVEAQQAFTTIVEDAVLLSTKQEYYRQNRRPNARRREYMRRMRLSTKLANTPQYEQVPTPDPINLEGLTPEEIAQDTAADWDIFNKALVEAGHNPEPKIHQPIETYGVSSLTITETPSILPTSKESNSED